MCLRFFYSMISTLFCLWDMLNNVRKMQISNVVSFFSSMNRRNYAIDIAVYTQFFFRIYTLVHFRCLCAAGCYDCTAVCYDCYQFEIVAIQFQCANLILVLNYYSCSWSGSSIKLIDSKFESFEPNCKI